ncbi:MAG: hypothetical protein ACO1SV_12695 [Fimbriimonas sp.]
MTKHLKFIALALTCSVAAYAIGFAVQGSPTGAGTPSQGQSPARRISLKEGFTPIQDALASYIIHHGSSVIDDEGDVPTMQKFVVSQNYLLLLLQTPAQQDNHRRMINIDRLPSRWDRVKSVPSLANAILRITPEQKQLFAKWAFQGAPGAAAAIKRGVSFREARYRQLLHEQKMIRTILTPAQRTEWDAILGKVRAELGPSPYG